MNITIVDSFNFRSTHEMFNAGLLSVCKYISKDIEYYACKSNIDAVKNILKESDLYDLRFKPILVLKGEFKYFLIFKYLLSTIINLFYLLFLDKKRLLIYNCNNVFFLKSLNKINNILKKKVIIICHGELELLNDNMSDVLGLQAKTIKYLLLKFYLNKNIVVANKVRYIVLGDCILKNIKTKLSTQIANNFFSIDHPYVFTVNKSSIDNKKINFGTVGVVNKIKNIENMVYLANVFSEEIKNKKIIFSITGKVIINKDYLLKEKLDLPNNSHRDILRNNYDKRLAMIDYFLFFYDSRIYNFTASGAVFDAINYEKPIIALKNTYFEYLFEKYGQFGILVDSIEEMITIIREIVNNKRKLRYDFDLIKKNLSLKKIARQFEFVLKGCV